ncbi:ABC transporter permease subunit [Nocardia vaccinii]|uniref:ABC transporter permease subunit n=1 Tax=Nocardia vaccinii TaxID=1822 RepID=UPI00082F1A20|nr:ABC transporter permease subunit [Nocardia vaccinii]
MSSTPPSLWLVADTVRTHRRGILGWIVGGAVAMPAIAAGFRSEVGRFAGGPRGMADSMQAGVQAMRLLRWPADRLDTLGGYLTYHNVTLFVLFLALYSAVQGVGAVRGAEAGHAVEVILATGQSRSRLVLGRTLGFAVVLAVIGVGLGLGLAGAMAIGGESNLSGSLLTGFGCAACAFAGYGIGAVVGQLGGTPRSSNAVAALIVVAAYLYTNVWDRFGRLEVLRFASPFYYFTRCRALVPGVGFDVVSLSVLLAAAALSAGAAAWVFCRRDIGSPLLSLRARPGGERIRVQQPALARLWTAILVRERSGLFVWAAAAAAGVGLMAWLEPEVTDMWEKFDISRRMLQADPGFSPADQYLGFVSEFTGPIVAAFVTTQAAGWAGDLAQGRTAMLLSTPLSRAALIRQRLAALIAGAVAVIVAATAGMSIAMRVIDADAQGPGLVRTMLTMLLFAIGLAGVGAWFVAWFPRFAVTALGTVLALSYLLMLLVPMFGWPSWLTRLSVFGAIGHPYLQNPPLGSLAFLGLLAVTGYLLAVVGSNRLAAAA